MAWAVRMQALEWDVNISHSCFVFPACPDSRQPAPKSKLSVCPLLSHMFSWWYASLMSLLICMGINLYRLQMCLLCSRLHTDGAYLMMRNNICLPGLAGQQIDIWHVAVGHSEYSCLLCTIAAAVWLFDCILCTGACMIIEYLLGHFTRAWSESLSRYTMGLDASPYHHQFLPLGHYWQHAHMIKYVLVWPHQSRDGLTLM